MTGSAIGLVTNVVGFVTVPFWGPCAYYHSLMNRKKNKKLVPLLNDFGGPQVATIKSNDLI